MRISAFTTTYTKILMQMEMTDVYSDNKSEDFSNLSLLNYELTEVIFPYLAKHGGKLENGVLTFEGKKFYPLSDSFGKQHTEFLESELTEAGYKDLMNLKLGVFSPEDLETELTGLISDINLAKQGGVKEFDTPMSVDEFKSLFSAHFEDKGKHKIKVCPTKVDLLDIERAIYTFGARAEEHKYDLDQYDAMADAFSDIQYDAKCNEVPSEYEDNIEDGDIELSYSIDDIETALDVNFLTTFVDGQKYVLPAYLPCEYKELEGQAVNITDLSFMETLEDLSQKVNGIAEGIIVEYSGSYATKYHEGTWGFNGGDSPYWDTEHFEDTAKLGDYLDSDKLVAEVSGMNENPVREEKAVFREAKSKDAI